MSPISSKRIASVLVLALVVGLAAVPTVLGALGGSGNTTDIVQLSTTVGSVGTLTSTAAAPDASSTAFTMTNSGSNVDTFLLYGWNGNNLPYYGASSGNTAISLRGVSYSISNLLSFKQETVTGSGTTATSAYYSPLVLKAATSSATTMTPTGNACTGWTGTASGAFTKVASGTLTLPYQVTGSVANDAPSSATFSYCAGTEGSVSAVYLSKLGSPTFATTDSTQIVLYSESSSNGVLKSYQYEFLPGGHTAGNKYCLTGFTGTLTDTKPDLAQCSMMPYSTLGVATAKLSVLYDPPALFPATNQGGALTFAVSGTQWNPYASGTTNSA